MVWSVDISPPKPEPPAALISNTFFKSLFKPLIIEEKGSVLILALTYQRPEQLFQITKRRVFITINAVFTWTED